MNLGRVRQIVDSPNEIVVCYHGEPVWIKEVDEYAQTARVYTREQPDDEMVVPIHRLEEGQATH